MAKSTICTILKNRETIKKADVARGVTVITKQRSQTIEEEVKNLCTKYCCKSLNKQSSGIQERINPFYINSYGENSFGLRTTFRNEFSFLNRGLTVSHEYSLHDRGSGPEREIIIPFVKSFILTLKLVELTT